MEDDKQIRKRNISVLMFPWLAHGHISPYLEVAKKLAHRNFQIYFCSTPVNLNSIKQKLFSHHPNTSYSNSIHLVEFHLSSSLPELPPHYHTTKGLPPHLLPSLTMAVDMAKPEFSKILETLKPDLLIHDLLPTWASNLASSLNIPTIAFMICAASLICYGSHFVSNKGGDEFPFPEICPDSAKSQLVKKHESSSTNNESGHKTYGDVILIRSLRELEGKYMDYLSVSFNLKVIPVGFLVPDNNDDEGMDIINWLDKKEKHSTVLVSFGSEYYLSKEDMEEMAYGLELSMVNFIWVIRFPVGEKMELEEALPEKFLEKVGDRGLVIENWAPQVKILNHSSIGGFVNHSGISSIMESLKFGVPIIAMPMQNDQPWNARVIVVSGVSLEVERNSDGRIERGNVTKVIKQVMVEKIGEDIRRNAKEMSNKIRAKVDEEEINELETEILRLCADINVT
ncbi:beta-D-glucosyl crocetin beta-1,6-glucosyltransferase [Ziziphus jujuba]|uniref:Beta-D-glucosyl crocetin beta-1,6-glucosyltransferase n=1 Tax=Ziziphus jujuba TaxID=326968 RepID=A0A6P3ZYB4_ZIZJJ|nr:beta-D-glucosyl crocetin beta-1,6-glucosyltransferase [Ziziphus jujuba]